MADHANPSAVRAWLIAGLTAFVLYYRTAAPGVIWQDGGELQIRVALDEFRGDHHLARVHVLTVLLGSGLKHVLHIDAARAATLVSVVAGAFTIANVAALLVALGLGRLAVAAATIMLACSHTLWQFAAAAETNTLVVALMSAELLALQRFALTGRPVWLCAVAFLNGLDASNHALAFLTLAAYAVVAMTRLRHWRSAHVRPALVAAGCWLAGFAPMLVLIVLEARGGASLLDILRSMFVSSYGGYVFNLGVGPRDPLRIAAFFALSFPTPLILLLPFGFRPLRDHCPTWFFRALLILLGVHFLFAVRYNVVDQYAFFIPTYVLMMPLLAAAIGEKVEKSKSRKVETEPASDRAIRNATVSERAGLSSLISHLSSTGAIRTTMTCLLAVLPVAVYVVLPSLARRLPSAWVPIPTRPVPHRDPYAWFLQPWRHNSTGPARFAREALDDLPQDALVLVDNTLRAPLVYTQIAERRRRDVQINDGRWQPWLRPIGIDKTNPAALDPLVAAGRLFLGSDERRYTPNYGWVLERHEVMPIRHLFRVQIRPPDPNAGTAD